MSYTPIPPEVFVASLGQFAKMCPTMAKSLSSFAALDYALGTCYLSADRLSGFYVHNDGDLRSVFSSVLGRGDELVSAAVRRGALSLDCFDGHLTRLYSRHGFGEVWSEANWHGSDLPRVVYMKFGHGR